MKHILFFSIGFLFVFNCKEKKEETKALKSNTNNIALLTPAPGSLMATTNDMFMMHFKEKVTVNPKDYISIFNEDGSLFEKVKLDSIGLEASASTRIIFNPKKEMIVGNTYYVNVPQEAFGDSTAINGSSVWSFKCGQALREVSMFSHAINDDFRLLIGLPTNYNKNSEKIYPVVYITDGGFFNHNQYNEIATASVNGEIVDMITVGIAYPEKYNFADERRFRTRDLARTPDNLFNFLKDTIIPFINKEYRTQPDNNTLIGNSLGGVFTTGVLMRYRKDSDFPFKNLFAVA